MIHESADFRGRGQQPGHHIQLVVTKRTKGMLNDLKEGLEAESIGEVIRRALMLRERYEPDYGTDHPGRRGTDAEEMTERLHAILPQKSMQRLQRLKIETGAGSYAEVIRQSLQILMELAVKDGWVARPKEASGRCATHDESRQTVLI